MIALLEPNAGKGASASVKDTHRERALKRYKNPHNGEVVETKGGNHKTLKAWKAQYGAEKVESWLQYASAVDSVGPRERALIVSGTKAHGEDASSTPSAHGLQG